MTNFEGHRNPENHHTTGHRAWCLTDSTWCYPNDACPCCTDIIRVEPGERHDFDTGHVQNNSPHPIYIHIQP